jgi:cell division protein ZipA
MNTLFLIFSLLIIIASATFFGWRYWRKRLQPRVRMAERPERDLYADRYFEDHPLDPQAIAEKPPFLEPPLVEDEVEIETEQLAPISKEAEPILVEETSISQPPPKKSSPPRKSEILIALFVLAKKEPGFLGTDIFTVLEDLGLKYGEMNIFHHYGLGELKVKKPIFSIANILEPGTFEPQHLPDFVSPGIALFMRLPGPFGGRVAFELMLNSAQKVAEILEGEILDEKRSPIDQKKITALRERIANFEQRNTHLSMLKKIN